MRMQLPTNTHQHCCFFPPWLSGNFSLVSSLEYRFNCCSYWIIKKTMLLLYKFQCCEDFLTSTSQFVCLGKLASLNCMRNFAWEKQAAVQPTVNVNAACNYNCKVFAPKQCDRWTYVYIYACTRNWAAFICSPHLHYYLIFPVYL